MIVGDLELDLDCFRGPFDLLLALVMREELELAEVPVAEIVAAYVEHAYDHGELDLDSASEFLVLIAALLEIKVRMLFPGEEPQDEEELTAEQAEAELIGRLIEYRRFRNAAAWLAGRLEAGAPVFRTGPPPLAPRVAPEVVEFSEDPWRLHAAISTLLVPPPAIDLSAVRRRLVPVSVFLDRFRELLAGRRGFAFDEAVEGLDRLSQAAAFLAVLELVKRGEAVAEQADVFAPIRVARRGAARPAVPVTIDPPRTAEPAATEAGRAIA
jgi:segregation and condensation protein A